MREKIEQKFLRHISTFQATAKMFSLKNAIKTFGKQW